MKHKIIAALTIFATALLLSNCTQSGPCEGSLTLENPIPDITVAVGDTVFIDLANPPVFVSSDGEVTYDVNGITGLTNIRVNLINNPNNDNKNTLFLINGIKQGESIIELLAYSGCLENKLTFNIKIMES